MENPDREQRPVRPARWADRMRRWHKAVVIVLLVLSILTGPTLYFFLARQSPKRKVFAWFREKFKEETKWFGLRDLPGEWLRGSWDDLHRRGLAALERGDLADAEIAFRSAAVVAQKEIPWKVHRNNSRPTGAYPDYIASIFRLGSVHRFLGR